MSEFNSIESADLTYYQKSPDVILIEQKIIMKIANRD